MRRSAAAAAAERELNLRLLHEHEALLRAEAVVALQSTAIEQLTAAQRRLTRKSLGEEMRTVTTEAGDVMPASTVTEFVQAGALAVAAAGRTSTATSAAHTSSAPIDVAKCEKDKPCQVTVFFATDRNIVRRDKVPVRFQSLQYYFGGDRDLRLPEIGFRLGECSVTIPPQKYEPYSGKLDYVSGRYDPQTSVFVKDDRLFNDENDWLLSLNERVDADPDREAFVFIHGFNVSFIDAARRTAQIYYDLGFKGAPIFYSWPSGGNLWNYWADEASVEWSTSHLRAFLDFVAQKSHATRVHLIAHSMGNRALTRALAEIGGRNLAKQPDECNQQETKFQQVILAAPDLDTDLFLQLQCAIENAAQRVTLYASKRDRAVLASWILHRFRRLGFPSGNTAPPDIDAVDATAASSDFLGHSYYGESILWDIKLMLEQPSVGIESRCTLARESSYYRFLPQTIKEAPGRIKRAILFLARRREQNVITTASCPVPASAPAGTD